MKPPILLVWVLIISGGAIRSLHSEQPYSTCCDSRIPCDSKAIGAGRKQSLPAVAYMLCAGDRITLQLCITARRLASAIIGFLEPSDRPNRRNESNVLNVFNVDLQCGFDSADLLG